ncbi:MAG: hypothetical protein HY756_07365 [Nitrospirae bacterium]|nr:hypothetical protein [Nitrospirota bacterium]
MKILVSISFLSIDLFYFYSFKLPENTLKLNLARCHIQCLPDSLGIIFYSEDFFTLSISLFLTSRLSILTVFTLDMMFSPPGTEYYF